MEANTKTILLIEDDAGLTELLAEKIVQCNYKVTCVQSANIAINWLKDHIAFLIILDYSLPDMDGKELISELVSKGISLPPFIVSIGQGDERIALEMIKLGAKDYIIKDKNFLDMIPLVINKVTKEVDNENKLRLAELALKESEEKQRAMLANISDVIAIVNKKGINTYKSPNIEKLFGWKPEELVGARTLDNVHPADFDRIQKAFYKLLENPNSTKNLEFRYKCKNNSYRWIELNATNRIQDSAINGVLLNYHDITERKQSEVELMEREINYIGLFNTVKQAIYIQNPDSTFIAVNQGAVEMYGYEMEYFIGKTPEVLSAPGKNNMDNIIELVNLAFNGQPQKFEFWGLKKDGTVFPKDVWTVKGRYFGKDVLITLATDITDRKLAEQELTESENKYRTMIDYSNDLIWTLDKNGCFTFFNEIAAKTTGLNLDKWKGKSFLPLILEEDLKMIIDIFHRNMNGEACNYELRFRKEDESILTISVNTSPIYICGKIEGVVSFGRDITESKKIKQELIIAKEKAEESEHKVRSMFENTLTGFLFFTATGQILEANPAAIRILGSPSFEATSKINVLTFKPLIDNGFCIEINKCIEEKRVVTNEMLYTSKWGKTVYVKYFLIPIFHHNEIIGVWANLQDLTDLWQTQTALKTAKEKAEESDQLKTAFLNNVSHEFRTPMNAIVGFSRLLANQNSPQAKRENYAQIVEKGCNQLLEIVTNVIEISEIQAIQTKVSQNETDLHVFFDEIKDNYQQKAIDKNLQFIVEIDLIKNQFQTITDKYKLTQIFKHLINNSLKFTKTGFIKIEVKSSSLNKYVFSITDSGIGIPAEMQEKIFDAFRQVEIGAARNFGGTGVGLSIAKAYIEILGGNICLKSELNKGTTISFTIPCNPVEIALDSNNQKLSDFNFENKVILVAEDEFSNYLLLTEYLNLSGAKILHAANGVEAIDYCRNLTQIDVVLMDIKMPIKDGFTAAKQIKEFRPELPIIAQTSYALESEKIKFTGVFNDYLTKPINKNELMVKLMNLINKIQFQNQSTK